MKRKTKIALVAAAGVLAACGLAQKNYNNQQEVWAKGQAALKAGMTSERLLACAGEPYRVDPEVDGVVTAHYGSSIFMGSASAWCVLAVKIEAGKVTGFSTRSANPGGFTDGSSVCSFVLDRCVSDGLLHVEAAAAGTRHERMRSDADAGHAQRAGEAGRNAVFLGAAMAVANRGAPGSTGGLTPTPTGAVEAAPQGAVIAGPSPTQEAFDPEDRRACAKALPTEAAAGDGRQRFGFRNACIYPIRIFIDDGPEPGAFAGLFELKPGQSQEGWWRPGTRTGPDVVVCRATLPGGEDVTLDRQGRRCAFRRAVR